MGVGKVLQADVGPIKLFLLHINITKIIIVMTDVWAWEKYYKQAEVLQRIDVELLPTETTVIVHYHAVGNRRMDTLFLV